ncbi:MAG: anthranilate phosphoribosyltransferase [Deltaproteobacteria bacterium]|nr:anthranilate phosphoribosyltransferase [Deltaproteobacteria bacterium]
MRASLEKICSGENLTQEETDELFSMMAGGRLEPIEISALLVALRAKGECPDEIAGAARALRRSATQFPRPEYVFADSCGTGGDGIGTINVSTAVAIVAAEMGVPMAKHGNRSVSSKCGSADVLEKLGVKIDASPEVARRCMDEAGICFLFAPLYHRGLRHAMPVRQTLKIRTIFNLLGPLVNPSAPAYQVMGVYDPTLCAPMAEALGLLGCTAALVVYGSGLDEIALHGPTTAAVYREGAVQEMTMSPEQAGLTEFPLEQLRGGDAEQNAETIANILKGKGDEAHEAVVAINAGALAWIVGRAGNIKEGTALALETIRSGRSMDRLKKLTEISHGA